MCPTHYMPGSHSALLSEVEAAAHLAQAHVLVVDDMPSMRRVVCALLREHFREVRISEAVDGRMALQMIRSAQVDGRPIDFVVTDLHMPNMDGISLLQALREEQAGLQHLPVLLVTAEATRDMILKAAHAGADGYIVKPFNATTLRQKLEQIMARRRLACTNFAAAAPA